MNITLLDKELEVFEDNKNPFENRELFNYSKTMAGHTLMIGTEYYLESQEIT